MEGQVSGEGSSVKCPLMGTHEDGVRTRSGRIGRHQLGGEFESLGVDEVAQKMAMECGGKSRGGNPRDMAAQDSHGAGGASWSLREEKGGLVEPQDLRED